MQQIYDQRVKGGNLEPDAAQLAVLPELDRLRSELEAAPIPAPGRRWFRARREPAPKGLYMWGGVGRGKSMLMDMFHDAVSIPDKRRVHFHGFMQEVQAGLHEARKTGVDDAIKPVADDIASGVRLLSFDEMQITDIADAMIVGRLFQRLFDAGVTIVTTSNRPPDDLYLDGLNRGIFLPFIALLKERLTVRELSGPDDFRQNRLGGEQVYFTPANSKAREKVSEIWKDMTGGEAAPLTLNVKGRDVEIPAFRNGAARATFWELCGKPLGPADYLALADVTRVLILEDVPLLSSENYNEAKRFVTLIDTLYEAHVRLIMTAADVPERLYLEGEGSFEFERTASRLREMQSKDWADAST